MAKQGIIRGCRVDESDWEKAEKIAREMVPPSNRLDIILIAIKTGLNEFVPDRDINK